MNLKDFKKVQEDDHKAVLQNSKGHSFTIAKKALSPKHLDALKNLPLHASDGNDGEPIPEQSNDSSEGAPESIHPPMTLPQNDSAPGLAPAPTSPEPEPIPEPEQAGMAAQPASDQTGQPVAKLNPDQEYQNSYNKTMADHAQQFGQEAALSAQDLRSGHITPETYHDLFAKKDTLGKIGTLFGLLISGAGSGLAHQPNAVLSMMDKEIDRDVEAQKQSKEGARNLYRLNMENELNKAGITYKQAETSGVLKDIELKADTHTKNQMLIGSIGKMEGITNKLPPGQQKAQAAQVLQGASQAAAAKIQQNSLSGAKALVDNPEGEFQKRQKTLRQMQLLGMGDAGAVADSESQRHMPGFGDSANPIPPDVRQELVGKAEYDRAAKEYVDFAKKHAANWANLNAKERIKVAHEGAVKAALLQGKFRLATRGGVYKTGEQEFIQKIIPDNAVSWQSSFNQIPKVEQTISNNESDAKTLAQGAGLTSFNGFGGGKSEGGAPQKDKMPPDGTLGRHSSGPVIVKGGKWVPR